MGSSSTSADASADARTSSRRETSPASRPRPSTRRCGWSTRTTRRATAGWSGSTWPGRSESYDHLPFFYSDLFDLGYEAVGELDPRHETVAEWDEPNRKGVVYYLDAERHPRGVLLWNIFGRVDAARDLIRAHQPIDASTLSEPVG